MRLFNEMVFDDFITGSSTKWYTPNSFCERLGEADYISLFARSTLVSGTSPTLTIRVEHSPDGEHWTNVNTTAEINANSITEGAAFGGFDGTHQLLGYVRCSVAMVGTSPKCRLKLYVSARTRGR